MNTGNKDRLIGRNQMVWRDTQPEDSEWLNKIVLKFWRGRKIAKSVNLFTNIKDD